MALFDDVYVTSLRAAMTEWAKAHPDAELTMVDAANDSAKQTGQIKNFLAQGMDAVGILPVDTAATGPNDQGRRQSRQPLGLRQSQACEPAQGRRVLWFQFH